MSNPRCVIVYGNSLGLAGIAIALRNRPEFKVVTIEAEGAQAAEQLDAVSPDVIIFDLAQADAPLRVRLQQRGARLVIGIDSNSDHLLLYSAQRSRAVTMQDLVQVIDTLPG